MLGEPDVPPGQQAGKKITPAVHWGIKVISVGFFVERDGAVVWRGPMIHKLLQQFLDDVEWGELDYLVIDLPPGTGDAQLSLSQLIPITGAVMVTTPQEIALIDVVKAVSMFKKVEIPILGVVENMSYYMCPACGHNDEIFSHGGGKRLAKELGTLFLGEIPIDAKVRHGGDSGRPVVVGAPESEHAKIFMDARGQGRRRGRQAQRPGRRHGQARGRARADPMSGGCEIDETRSCSPISSTSGKIGLGADGGITRKALSAEDADGARLRRRAHARRRARGAPRRGRQPARAPAGARRRDLGLAASRW